MAVLLALLAGLLGRFAWPLDLFSHFRVQYTVLLLLLAITLLRYRRRALAVLSLVGAVISAVPVAAYVSMPARAAEAGSRSFRLVSFNVWFRNDDFRRIARYLESTQADAIVLQEVGKQGALELKALLPSYPHSYLEGGHRYGAIVFARWPIVSAREVALTPEGVRAAHVTLAWGDAQVGLLGTHLRWPLGRGDSRLRNQDLQGLAAFARAQAGPLMIAGDFNVTPWSSHYRQALAASAMTDVAQGHGIVPTWPAPFPPLGISIDHCLASNHWRSVNVQSGPYVGSDHRPLIVDLQLKEADGR